VTQVAPTDVVQESVGVVQSEPLQQEASGMQDALAVHAFWPVGHEQTPAAQVSPAFGQVLGG
jgi:hypothetical protein